MKAEIYLKSGQTFTVEVEELTTRRGRVQGELTKLAWTTPANAARSLHTLELDQIAAIVVIQ